MQSTITPPEKPTFIRGRTVGSLNLLYKGFRYGKDGKPTIDSRQAWRCVLRKDKCPGRVYTLGDSVCDSPRPHCHPANFLDCEVKAIYSNAKDLKISSNNPPSQILNAVKCGASEATLLHLPKPASFKRALNKTKAAENPTPKAPSSLADLQLDSSTIVSYDGDPMLIYDNEDPDKRIIILATQPNLLLLKRSPSWYVDATFRVTPQLFCV